MSPQAVQDLIAEARFLLEAGLLRKAGKAFLAGFRGKAKEAGAEEASAAKPQARAGRCPTGQGKNYDTGRCEKPHYTLKALRDTAATTTTTAKTRAAGASQEHHGVARSAHRRAADELSAAGFHGLARDHRTQEKFHAALSQQGTRAKKPGAKT